MTDDTGAGVEKLAVICAGRGATFDAEDAPCTGTQTGRRRRQHPETKRNDGSGARELTYRVPVGVALLSSTKAGQRVVRIGLPNDLAPRVGSDRCRLASEMEGRVIRVPPTRGRTWKGHRGC